MASMQHSGYVLVLDGQWRHALSITRSLGKKGINVAVGDPSKTALSKFSKYCCKKLTYPDPQHSPDDFLEYLLRFSRQQNVDLIIPNSELTVELLSKHKSEFDKITRIPIRGYEVVSKLLDKAKLMRVASKNGIPCPKTYFIEEECDISKVADRLEYPAIIKPRKSTGALGLAKVSSKDEFLKQYPLIHKIFPFPIVQDFIPGPPTKHNFCAIINGNGETKASFSMEHLRLYPYEAGVGTYGRSIKNDILASYGIKLLNALEWYGIAQVEFKIDPRDRLPKLLEVNPRFWGMTEMAVCSGMDLPYHLYKMVVCGDNVEHSDYMTEQYLRWLPGEILHFLSNPYRMHILNNFLRFFDKNLHYYILSKDDPLPTLGLIISSITGLSDKHTRQQIFRRT